MKQARPPKDKPCVIPLRWGTQGDHPHGGKIEWWLPGGLGDGENVKLSQGIVSILHNSRNFERSQNNMKAPDALSTKWLKCQFTDCVILSFLSQF